MDEAVEGSWWKWTNGIALLEDLGKWFLLDVNEQGKRVAQNETPLKETSSPQIHSALHVLNARLKELSSQNLYCVLNVLDRPSRFQIKHHPNS
jgi:hypothetical protein